MVVKETVIGNTFIEIDDTYISQNVSVILTRIANIMNNDRNRQEQTGQ